MAGEDQRKHPRIAIPENAPAVTIHLSSATGATIGTRTVRASDLSRTGMGFVDKTPIPVGTRCTIMLAHQSRPLRVIGKVTNCRKTGEMSHIIGIKFTSIAPTPADQQVGSLTDDPRVGQLIISV